MADNVIYVKFKKGTGISLPSGGVLSPNLYPTTKSVNGFGSPIAVQDYNFDEVYEIKLLPEMPQELPAHLANLDPEVKKAFVASQASGLSENHKANNVTRAALKLYEDEGIIETVHDSFKDRKPGEGEWRLQDSNQGKRLEKGSLDLEVELKRRDEPNPHVGWRNVTDGDANTRATSERNEAFGSHEGVPTTEDPKPNKKGEAPKKKGTVSPTSTENKSGQPALKKSDEPAKS